MDPLTAVGLAGNIVGFVDFSAKVLVAAKRLRESATGSTEQHQELELMAKNLKELAGKTQRKPSNIGQRRHIGPSITGEAVLNNLGQQCAQIAEELLETLNSLKVKPDSSGLHSVVQVVKSMRRQDDVESLQRRLDRVSKQLIDAMSMEQLDEINRRLRDLAVENTRLEANRSAEISQLRRDFQSAIEEIQSGASEEQLPGAWLVLSDSARHGQVYFAEQIILNTLKFSSISSRHESISREHNKTFSWIFEPTSTTKFVEWLTKDDGVYWVSGKPGSGKSTLMKFLAGHEQTTKYLEQWAGAKKLICASFFFWNASSHRSQKSQKGLLRTILYQILRQCPELIRVAYEDQWIAMTSDGRILKESVEELHTIPALLTALRKISSASAHDTSFCFFVDGLDEYDGKPADIIELVDILKSFPNVKACVSSRPWNDFDDYFGNASPWKLYMQDLTMADIHLVVEEKLGENPLFQQLASEDHSCHSLIDNIINRADGVFLWVSLVLQSLLEGLANSDRIRDLQDRVNDVPNELHDFFNKMLFSTENRYRTQTAQLLAVVLAAPNELPLMAYWVMDQEDPEYVVHCSAGPPSINTLSSRLKTMRRRLIVLSKGLLEVKVKGKDDPDNQSADDLISNYRVDFSHRTVKDYLKTPEALSMLTSWSDQTFNPDLEIFRSCGVLMKWLPVFLNFHVDAIGNRKSTDETDSEPESAMRAFSEGFQDCTFMFFDSASVLDSNSLYRTEATSVIEHLHTALTPTLEECMDEVNAYLQSESFLAGTGGLTPDMLVMTACVLGLVLGFVSDKFTTDPNLCQRVTERTPVLSGLSRLAWDTEDGGFPVYDHRKAMLMMELLLAHGADPNRVFRDSDGDETTEWVSVIHSIRFSIDTTSKFEIAKLFLRHGANFEELSYPRGNEIVCDVLRSWFDNDQYSVLEDIVKRRAAKGSTSKKLLQKLRHLKLWARSIG